MGIISPGSKMPAVHVKLVSADAVSDTSSDEACAGPLTVLFTLPGAFTPTCHNNHLPGFIINFDKLKDAGVEKVICATVNDHHVVKAWGQATGAFPYMDFIADGNGELAKALGVDVDMRGGGMGTRMARAAFIIENGKIAHAGLETKPGEVIESGAEAILKVLQSVDA